MLDVPTWVWQVAAAIGGGLGLGVGLGALMQRGRKRVSRAAPATGTAAATTGPAPLTGARAAEPRAGGRAGGTAGSSEPAEPTGTAPPAQNSRGTETPQQRLLERQREHSAQLAAQLRTAGEAHARELGAKVQEHQAERLRAQRELEALRQSHAEELAHLMSVLVEQVDKIHQAHARHVRLLEAEVARARAGRPAEPLAGTVDTGPTAAMVAEAARRPRQAPLPALELDPASADNPASPLAAAPVPALAPPKVA